jgi:hypothetical protein
MTLKSYVSIPLICDNESICYIKVTIDELIKTYLRSPIPDNNCNDGFCQNLNKLSFDHPPDYF